MSAIDTPTPPIADGQSNDTLEGPMAARTPHRYSAFDSGLFTLTDGSPTQAKRALEAHIADTDRRIRDASKLGTNLLEQKKQLSDRLNDVEAQQASNEIGPELKQQLAELERDYNDLGRESARSLLPRARTNGESVNGRHERSASPTKPTAPASTSHRKSRNTSSRVEDLAFATEISTSLLGQVRHLQNVLAEKEDALRQANSENYNMRSEADSIHARLKAYEDNEQRYKDENWQLDTQVQELSAQVQDHTSRHQRLEQNLVLVQSERSNMEREGDELRLAHGTLTEQHAALRKKHETDLANLRRNITSSDEDRDAMQRKIGDLTSQNEELARAVAYRMRNEGQQQPPGAFLDSEEEMRDQTTPEPSPPGSPTKGTPRHGALESETLKSSLHHAHRMIQNLKNNIHREKTEKLELRRMLQDARDEVESRRADGGMMSKNKSRKQTSDKDLFKKPARPDQLGSRQSATEEIMNDPSWEDDDGSPTRQAQHRKAESRDLSSTDASDAFETANEAETTDAFESAESVMGASTEGEETETEATAAGGTLKNRPGRVSHMPSGSRSSFLSTASDEDMFELSTPPRSDRPPYRLRVNRERFRESSVTPAKDSPASFISNSSQGSQMTPTNNLAAELDNLDDGSSMADSTPSRSIASESAGPTPNDEHRRDTQIRATPSPLATKSRMVDTDMLTEPWEPETSNSAETGILGAVVGAGAAGLVALGLKSKTDDEQSAVQSQSIAEASEPHSFGFSRLTSQHTTPIAPVQEESAHFSPNRSSSIYGDVIPVERQVGDEAVVPTTEVPSATLAPVLVPLSFSNISSQHVAPVQSVARLPDLNMYATPSSNILREAYTPSSTPSRSASRPAPSMAAVDRIIQSNSRSVSPSQLPREGSRPPTATSRRAPSRDRPIDDIFVSDSARASPEESGRSVSGLTSRDGGRIPFQPVSGNAPLARSSMNSVTRTVTKTEGTQTMVSAQELDRMMTGNNAIPLAAAATAATMLTPLRPGSRSKAREVASPPPELTQRNPRRASNSSLNTGNARSASSPPARQAPPLPTDHRQVIAAASRTSSVQGREPPPSLSLKTSSSQQLRPRTPSQTFTGNRGPSPQRFSNGPTPTQQPRYRAPSVISGRPEGTTTRRSSLSSFASELDERFNAAPQMFPDYDPATADPRMIQAITQTMIGEFMWKYTRKAGSSSTFSNNRHKRFFWIHPYTRTLYWSVQDPSRQGSSRTELKAKSVPIEAVRVVTDENPSPPGLWQKSIIILTPGKSGRSIKFTAPTGMRHETWFNALSYLLLRNNEAHRVEDTSDAATTATYASMRSSRLAGSTTASMRASRTTVNRNYSDASPMPSQDRGSSTLANLTAEDVSEFNPTLHPGGQSSSRSRLSGAGSRSHRSLRSTATGSPRKSYQTAQNFPSMTSTARSTAPSSSHGSPAQYRSKDINALAPASYTSQLGNTEPVQSTAGTAETTFDSQGFRVPAKPSHASTTSSRTSRLGSMTSRVGTIFGRSKSMSRTNVADEASTQGSNSNAPSVDSASTSTAVDRDEMVTPRQSDEYTGVVGSRRGGATVENVRACCDGKHDVGHLSHAPNGAGSLSGRTSLGSRYGR